MTLRRRLRRLFEHCTSDQVSSLSHGFFGEVPCRSDERSAASRITPARASGLFELQESILESAAAIPMLFIPPCAPEKVLELIQACRVVQRVLGILWCSNDASLLKLGRASRLCGHVHKHLQQLNETNLKWSMIISYACRHINVRHCHACLDLRQQSVICQHVINSHLRVVRPGPCTASGTKCVNRSEGAFSCQDSNRRTMSCATSHQDWRTTLLRCHQNPNPEIPPYRNTTNLTTCVITSPTISLDNPAHKPLAQILHPFTTSMRRNACAAFHLPTELDLKQFRKVSAA